MSYNVLLNGYPVASADTVPDARLYMGSPKWGRWSLENGYGIELYATKDERPKRRKALDDETLA